MREVLIEIWSSIRKNKLRTFLTGFSVAWGIFMLIILQGSGNGLENGIKANFSDYEMNSIELYSGRTSLPYAGYDKDRRIRLDMGDVNIIKSEFDKVDKVAVSGYYSGGTLTYGQNFMSNVSLYGRLPETQYIWRTEMVEGRYINQQDVDEKRKVIVIDEKLKEVLFKNESPLGRNVINNGIAYTVVGVYKPTNPGNNSSCYIPVTTGQLIYMANDPKVNTIMFTMKDIRAEEEMDKLEADIRRRLSAKHRFDPNDKNAVYIYNNFKSYKSLSMVFNGISAFIWVIGLGTLLAGIVGVSNIMLVTVKERTFEFGIRKALGAKPSSIIRLILMESVIITATFGYMGLVAGVGVMEAVNFYMEKTASGQGNLSIFLNPTVDIGSAVSATIVLIIAGLIAGYIPAKRAAQLKTIDAMRYNK